MNYLSPGNLVRSLSSTTGGIVPSIAYCISVSGSCRLVPTPKYNKLRKCHLLELGRRFQGARPNHVRVESSSCCFPRESVRFVRPREFLRFDP